MVLKNMFGTALKKIDDFLNKTTMYRLVFYCLIFLAAGALFLSFFGLLPFSPSDFLLSAVFITAVCYGANFIFAKVFGAPSNLESVYITALILVFLITPSAPFENLAFLGWAAVWAMASKYIFAIRKKHIFNPAAFAVVVTSLALNQSASWWVGTAYMLPFVLVAGILITRKTRRAGLVASFLVFAIATVAAASFLKDSDVLLSVGKEIFYSPIFFFAFVMLTEPMTTPPTRKSRASYGALVGFLFAPQIHLGNFYSTPELALLAGNIFSYLASPKGKFILKLKQISKAAADTYDFIFEPDRRFSFSPGQYMEWTFGYENPDNRGIRRYFTVASSPTERNVIIGVKFYPEASTFKKNLLAMKKDDSIVASGLAGDFTLPRDKKKKLVFIAGGIGVTPFRSMVKSLIDKNEARDVTLFFLNKKKEDVAYKNIFDEAEYKLWIKTIYIFTDEGGRLDGDLVKKEVPDFKDRTFYISGPNAMVKAIEDILKKAGVARRNIKKDFFPGFA